MGTLEVVARRLQIAAPDHPAWAATVLFCIVIGGAFLLGGLLPLVVAALSFWHYLIYALAFIHRGVSVDTFKRDAILTKTIALAVLLPLFAMSGPNPLAIIVVCAGFALNIAAARALGTDRTYYGYELGAVAQARITAFPFSVTAHPMLIGNMLGFGGMLLDAEFRAAWWPLVLAHVFFNFLTILLEAKGGQKWMPLAGVVVIALALAIMFLGQPMWLAISLAMLIYGLVLCHLYGQPNPLKGR